MPLGEGEFACAMTKKCSVRLAATLIVCVLALSCRSRGVTSDGHDAVAVVERHVGFRSDVVFHPVWLADRNEWLVRMTLNEPGRMVPSAFFYVRDGEVRDVIGLSP